MSSRTLKARWRLVMSEALAAVQSKLPRWAQGRDSGQGTTEYAILVGVLVVIAIIAIIAFRPKIQELWDAIVSGFQGL